MTNVTTQIATENKRPSLSQDILSLYKALHTGGAFDSKTETGQGESYNKRVSSFQSRHNTPAGFKIRMQEQNSELYMARDSKVVTTQMRSSIYGEHSNRRYRNGG